MEVALEQSRRVPGFRTLLLFFWGLIVAKCLLLEWAAECYHSPINTFLFVWIPSFMISGVITIVYAYRLFRELPRMPLSGRLVSATWVGCTTGFGVLALAAVSDGVFDVYLLPALAAVLLGVGCFIQSVVDRQRTFKLLAVGWWLAALGMFASPNVNALAWMALSLLLLLIIPSGWLFFTRKPTT